MASIFIYIFKWALSLTLLYSLYGLFLRKETFHRFNRMVLMGILLTSMVLPFCIIHTTKETVVSKGVTDIEESISNEIVIQYQPEEDAEGVEPNTTISFIKKPQSEREIPTRTLHLSLVRWLILLYLLGVIYFWGRYLVSISAIYRVMRKSQRIDREGLPQGVRLKSHPSIRSPFCWFGTIIIRDEDLEGNVNIREAIIAHELAHVQKRHSLKNYRASAALTALLQKAVKNQKNKDLWCAVLSSLTLMQFSQKQEDEADDVGQFKLAAAGFNPYGQVQVWERFLQKYGDSSGLQKFLSSHPSHKARIENAKKNLAKMNYQPPVQEGEYTQTPPAEVPFESGTSNSSIEKPTPAPRENARVPESVANQPTLPAKTNLVLDGSFEKGYTAENKLENWDVSEGLFKLSNSVYLSGNASLEGSSNGSFTKGRILSNFIPVTEDSNLTLEVCVKSENGKQVGAVGVELYDKNKRLRNRVWAKDMMAFPAEWNKIEANLVNSSNGTKLFTPAIAYMRVLLQVGPSSNGTLWFDDISVTQN